MHRIYAFTSIGRPVDPAWPSNRALLVVLALVAIGWAATGLLAGQGAAEAFGAALLAALVAFGAWALARELAPDHDGAAFLAIALALAFLAWRGDTSLALLFTALLLARIVNRSTGLAARWHDSALVTGLVAWTMAALDMPWLGVVGAVAFALDATLRQPLRRQWGFAVFCLGLAAGGAWRMGLDRLVPVPVETGVSWVALGVLAAFAVPLLATRRVSAPGDIGGAPLLAARVRGGMLVAWLLALQGCFAGAEGVTAAGAILATFAAVTAGRAVPRSPGAGLE